MTNEQIPTIDELRNDPIIRDFTTGTIADLAKPVSANEFSRQAVSRNAAFTSDDKGDAMAVGRLKQMQTAQTVKKHGGGWKGPKYKGEGK